MPELVTIDRASFDRIQRVVSIVEKGGIGGKPSTDTGASPDVWVKVISSAGSPGSYTYKFRLQHSGGADAPAGLRDLNAIDWDGENVSSSSEPLPDGSIHRAVWCNRAGVEILAVQSGGQLPTGEHQYQVYQMVSDNQAGWGFVRAHPDISSG